MTKLLLFLDEMLQVAPSIVTFCVHKTKLSQLLRPHNFHDTFPLGASSPNYLHSWFILRAWASDIKLIGNSKLIPAGWIVIVKSP